MRTRKLLTILSILGLSACVVIPKSGNMEGGHHVPRTSCEKIGIAFSVTDVSDSALYIEVPIDPKERHRGSMNPSFFIHNSLTKKDFITIERSPEIPQKYFIQFRVVSKDFNSKLQKASLLVSWFTLGILPGWGDGEHFLEANVFDINGKSLGAFKSSSINYDFYHGLIFLPINYHEHTFAFLNEKYLSQFTDEIIEKMIQSKLIKCKI